MFNKLEEMITKENEMCEVMSFDLDVYPNEKRAIIYMVESVHIMEIFKVDGGFYCSLMTELEEKTILRKQFKTEEEVINNMIQYNDFFITGKYDRSLQIA